MNELAAIIIGTVVVSAVFVIIGICWALKDQDYE